MIPAKNRFPIFENLRAVLSGTLEKCKSRAFSGKIETSETINRASGDFDIKWFES